MLNYIIDTITDYISYAIIDDITDDIIQKIWQFAISFSYWKVFSKVRVIPIFHIVCSTNGRNLSQKPEEAEYESYL